LAKKKGVLRLKEAMRGGLEAQRATKFSHRKNCPRGLPLQTVEHNLQLGGGRGLVTTRRAVSRIHERDPEGRLPGGKIGVRLVDLLMRIAKKERLLDGGSSGEVANRIRKCLFSGRILLSPGRISFGHPCDFSI